TDQVRRISDTDHDGCEQHYEVELVIRSSQVSADVEQDVEDDEWNDRPGDGKQECKHDSENNAEGDLEELLGAGVAACQVDDVPDPECDARDEHRPREGPLGQDALEQETPEQQLFDEADADHQDDNQQYRGEIKILIEALEVLER